MSNKKMIINAISAVLALGVTSVPVLAATSAANNQVPAAVDPTQSEKCYGIAKAGVNDCSAPGHNCGGEAKTTASKSEWLYVPTGLCNKIVGGTLSPTDNKKNG